MHTQNTQNSFNYYCETKHFCKKNRGASSKQQMTWSYRYRSRCVGNYIGRCVRNTGPYVQGIYRSKLLHTSNAGNVQGII